MDSFILKGDICYSRGQKELFTRKDACLVCEKGVCRGVFPEVPERFRALPLRDESGRLILPGMVDLHIHAPQFAFRGLGMDMELLDWLKAYTFPEESRYADRAYAQRAYSVFARAMKNSATTRACVFATVHREATILLMDLLEETGLSCFVGKINMDRYAPDDLREPAADLSAYDTFGWLNAIRGRYRHTFPILTPRFLPSCSDALLSELREVQKAYDLPVQSHLSENPGEVELVRRLFPSAAFYGQGYDHYGLFGKNKRTVMAHCIYSTEDEIDLIRENGVFVAHCPASNMNLASGIAPVRRFLSRGIRVGLGSDVAGGESESIFRQMVDAIQVSKLYWRLMDPACEPVSFEEAFFLATLGGGAFFGKVGSFEDGYEADIIVLDDRGLSGRSDLTVSQRVQRAVYLEADRSCLSAKFVQGREIQLDV